MKCGLLYIPDYSPERYPSASHYYGEMLEQIQYEEQLGFDGVFFAEHYLGGYAFPSPAVFAAAVAQRTERMRIGIGVSLLPLHNPIRLAEEYAMLDALSHGRLDFGIGRGVLKAEYELFGIDEAESQGRFHEALEVILQAWTQDTVSYDGRYYSFHDVTALPKPVQRPYPPIWAACLVTPSSFTWAGQQGFHLMVAPFAYPEHAELQTKLALYREALQAAGHDPRARQVLGVYHLYVADTDAEAHAVAKEHFLRYFDFFAGLDHRAAWQGADYKTYQGGLSKVLGGIPYDDLDAGDCIIFGSPERCVQRLKRAQADYGLTYAIFEVNFGGFPHQQVMHSLERFAKEVMPHLQ